MELTASRFMGTLFQILFRVALLFIGLMFFMLLLFIGAVFAVFWAVRSLWYKVTGKPRPTFNTFGFTPRQGFDFFYGRTRQNPQAGTPRLSQREMDNVTDVQVKASAGRDDEGSLPKY